MKIILLDNIKNLGGIGSQVEVKPGYARNYLIPKSKALLATKYNISLFKKERDILQSRIIKKRNAAESMEQAISKIGSITIKVKSSVEGKLFGSVGSKIIASAISAAVGFKVFKNQIRLPNNEVLKFTGVYSVKIHVYDKIFSRLNVIVVNELENIDSQC